MKIHIHHSNLEMVFLPENTLCLILVCCLQRRLQRSISMVIMMIMFCWQKIESTTEHTQEGLCLSSLVLSLLLSTELAAAETIPWVSAIFPNKQGKIQPSPSIYALLFLFLLSFFTRPRPFESRAVLSFQPSIYLSNQDCFWVLCASTILKTEIACSEQTYHEMAYSIHFSFYFHNSGNQSLFSFVSVFCLYHHGEEPQLWLFFFKIDH